MIYLTEHKGKCGRELKKAKGRGKKQANTLYYAYKVSDMKY
jgi:hypothetical protein